jgi:hypothetical protein
MKPDRDTAEPTPTPPDPPPAVVAPEPGWLDSEFRGLEPDGLEQK